MSMLKVLVSCVLIGAVAAPVLAQGEGKPPAGERPAGRGGRGPGGGGGGPGGRMAPLSPEKVRAAWELQAKSVAASLGLGDDKAAAVVKAYVDARTNLGAAAERLRDEHRQKVQDGEDTDRQAMREELESLNTGERAKLETALSAALSADQTKTAMTTLGSFNRGWDQMVNSIAGFNLDAGKQADALKAVQEFVAAQSAARAGGPDGDREAMRTAMQSAREKLNTSLNGILTEDQMKQFQASTAGPGGRVPRGGGGDDAPGRGGRGGGPGGAGGGKS